MSRRIDQVAPDPRFDRHQGRSRPIRLDSRSRSAAAATATLVIMLRRTSFIAIGCALTVWAQPGPLNAQGLPSQEQILAKMTLANGYFMNQWPDPTVPIVTDKVRPSNIWTRSTYYEGLMALYSVDRQAAYYNYAVNWGEGHNWEPAYGGTTTRVADNQCAGQTYIELYQIDPQPERIDGDQDDDGSHGEQL